jgi:CDP-diacylglycerol--serine O-phosphatidyltransferase
LFTTAALFAGFYGIVAAMNAQYQPAAVAIYVAMVLDGLDGRVARLTGTESEFGVQYDSLSDMVSFGLAPALIMYEWTLRGMATLGWVPAKLGWLAAFAYAACAALRLARFNAQKASADKRYFVGLPSPSAAAVMMGLVWVGDDLGAHGPQVMWIAFVVTIGTAALMVSNFLYASFKDFHPRERIPFIAATAIVLAFVLASLDPAKVLFGGFSIYALSGLLLAILRRRRKAARLGSRQDGA